MAKTSKKLAPAATSAFAPGTRVIIRGEEWVVEKCLRVPSGGWAVHVQGLTELVEHHQAIFLTELDNVEALRPEDTVLVTDESPEYRQTRLFLETLIRRTPPADSRIHLGHKGALEVMPYQLVPTRRALQSLRPRLLIADGVGLGKTVEVGVLLSELIKRGRGRRILVVAIKSMLAQFQEELWSRFTIGLVRLDSIGIQRVQARIPSSRNPFSHFDRVIISVDTLKNNARYRAWLEQTRWDAVVIDECHNVANRGSQRARLARLLASTADSLILTSATPHNGRPESFANLMQMLDPTSVADETDFTYEDVKHLFVRRFKNNIDAEAAKSFSERKTHRHDSDASEAEEAALASLRKLTVHNFGRVRHGPDRLFRWVLLKAFLSSPEACLESIDQRLKRIASETTGDEPHPHVDALNKDAELLGDVRAEVAACAGSKSSKLRRIIAELDALGFDGGQDSPRVIIFSERIATLEMLETLLSKHYKLDAKKKLEPEDKRVVVFHAGLGDTTMKDIVEGFGKQDANVRLLLASDAASEGVNLHYFCNQLFHYDVPWSLIRLEQRMGRIDRFGQKQTPHLHYLLTASTTEGADQLITRKLIEKEEQVHKQLGEAGVVLGLYDAEREDEYLTTGVAEGKSADELIPDEPRVAAPPEETDDSPAVAAGINLLDLFAQSDADNKRSESVSDATATGPSLYSDDYLFAQQALRQICEKTPFEWEPRDDHCAIELWPPESFTRWREPRLPDEAIPENNQPYQLSADTRVVFDAMSKARQQKNKWPRWQLLWEQHPIFEWMLDGLAAAYARNEAPAIRVASLGAERAQYVFQAIVSNKNGQPVHSAWFALPVILRAGGEGDIGEPISLAEALEYTGFGKLSNAGKPPSRLPQLKALVPRVVPAARQYVKGAYKETLADIRADVRVAARRLETWRERITSRLNKTETVTRSRRGTVPAPQAKKLADRRKDIEHIGKDHQSWLDSLVDHGDPYVRLCAVFAGED